MGEPVRLHPDNRLRLLWRGKGAFLLGSTEHYGGLVNAAFDYERYLDTLAADGLTLTRVFACYRELEWSLDGQLGYANTLAPRPEQYLAPWARVPDAGAGGPDGLPKFDLDTWDGRYFARLQRFLGAAAARGIVVELVFFCNPYDEARWRHLPLHPASNVNGVGAGMAAPRDVLSLTDRSVVDHQQRLVRKLVAETNAFDNLYYEVCNEPGYARDGEPRPETVRDWQRLLVDTVRQAERALPKRHLVAVNPHMLLPVREPDNPAEVRIDLLDDGFYRHDPQVDLLNVHYISHRLPREGLHLGYPGGARPRSPAYRFGQIAPFVALRAAAGKAIGFDEDYSGVVDARPPRPAQKRLEAWEALLAGCATYDHLDFTFTTDDPTGAAAGVVPGGLPPAWFDGRPLRRQFSYVAAFAADLDLAALRPDLLAVQRTPWSTGAVVARATGAAAPLVAYLADLRRAEGGFGSTPLGGPLSLGGLPPGGRYAVRRLDPQSGRWTDGPVAQADGLGSLRLDVPEFTEDVLLHVAPAGYGPAYAGPRAPGAPGERRRRMRRTAAHVRLTRARVLAGGAAGAAGAAGAGAGAASLFAAGCGRGGPAAEQPAAAKRPVTLVVDNDWSAGDRLRLVQAWLEHARGKYPHVTAELHDNAASHEKTHAIFAADQEGDLFQLDQWLVPVYGPKGVLQDISSTVAALKFDESSIYDLMPDRTHWNGKRIGFLIQFNFANWVYNKNAFQDAGVPEPAPTWTWDDYTEVARRVHRPQDNRWGTIVIANEPWKFFHMADVPYWDLSRNEALFDRPAAREILQWQTDLVLKHQVAPSPRELAEKRPNFVNGGIAIHMQTFANPGVTRDVAGRFAWEILPVPQHPRARKQQIGMGGHPYLVTAKAKQRGVLTEAVQVLVSLFDKEVQDLYASGLNLSSLPILRSVATGPQWVQGMPSNYRRYTLDWLNDKNKYHAVGATIGRLEFSQAITPEFEKALNGEVSVEQAAINMTRAGTAALQQAVR